MVTNADLGFGKYEFVGAWRRTSNMPGSALAECSLSTAFDYLWGNAPTQSHCAQDDKKQGIVPLFFLSKPIVILR